MCARVWDTSNDGSLEFVSLTGDTIKDAIDIMMESFFLHENVCIGVKLPENPEAALEFKELCLKYAKYGISIVAIDKATKKVAALAINSLRVNLTTHPTYYEQYKEKCIHPSIKAVLDFMIAADNTVDVYELCNSNCSLEVTFVSVLPQYRGKGIARKLMELSIKIGKALLHGEDVKVQIDDEPLPITPPPTIITALCTANVTQHLARSLGFTAAAKINYGDFNFDGKTFASRIGPETPYATIEYLHL